MRSLVMAVVILAPLVASADDSICTKLIQDIKRDYDYSDIQWMPNGNPRMTESLVVCTYRAVKATMYANLPVMLLVTLNTDNGRYTVESR